MSGLKESAQGRAQTEDKSRKRKKNCIYFSTPAQRLTHSVLLFSQYTLIRNFCSFLRLNFNVVVESAKDVVSHLGGIYLFAVEWKTDRVESV